MILLQGDLDLAGRTIAVAFAHASITGKGNDTGTEALEDVVKAGAAGLKLHEDWGTTPSAIVSALDVGDKYDVQVNIHTDTLYESRFVESEPL